MWTFPCLEGSLHGQVCRGKGARCIQVGVGGFECACPEGEDGCQESSSYSSAEEEKEYGGQKVISSGDVSYKHENAASFCFCYAVSQQEDTANIFC